MTRLVEAISKRRQSDHISALFPYTWWTPASDPADGEEWYGLADLDGSLTRAGEAYVAAIGVARNRARG